MFGLFKKDPIEKLSKEYQSLLKKAHQASHSDRTKSDQFIAAADEVAKKIEELKNQGQ